MPLDPPPIFERVSWPHARFRGPCRARSSRLRLPTAPRRGHRARRAPPAGPGADHRLHPPQHAARLRGPAVPRGGREGGARSSAVSPTCPEDRYREELARGRIRLRRAAGGARGRTWASAQPGRGVPCFGTRLELRLAMLQYPLRTGPTEELVWYVAEANALRRVRQRGVVGGPGPADRRDAALGHARPPRRRTSRPERRGSGGARPRSREPGRAARPVRRGDRSRPGATTTGKGSRSRRSGGSAATASATCRRSRPPPPPPIRHRDLLLEATGVDADLPGPRPADPLLRRVPRPGAGALAAAPAGRGVLPRLSARCTASRAGRRTAGCAGWPRSSAGSRTSRSGRWSRSWSRSTSWASPRRSGRRSSRATLLALRGWGGMVRQVELRGDRVGPPGPGRAACVEFLAVRLLLDRFALADTARDGAGVRRPARAACARRPARMAVRHWPPSVEQRAFLVFQLAQVLGLSPDVLYRLDTAGVGDAARGDRGVLRARAAARLPPGLRAAVPHPDARRDRAARAAAARPAPARRGSRRSSASTSARSRSAATWRSWPRTCETFGAAGFFSVAMYYRGAADAHFVPLCPVVIRPQHWVAEEVDRRARASRTAAGRGRGGRWGRRRTSSTSAAATFAVGAVLTGGARRAGLDPAGRPHPLPAADRADPPAVFGRIVQTPPSTRLQLERDEPTPGPSDGAVGFTVEEMTDIGERLLRDIGLTSRVRPAGAPARPRLEQPEQPARVGLRLRRLRRRGAAGRTRRAMAQILNDPRVRRAAWPARAVDARPRRSSSAACTTPATTRSPSSTSTGCPRRTARSSRRPAQAIEATCDRNAHERCRRFMSAPLTLSFAGRPRSTSRSGRRTWPRPGPSGARDQRHQHRRPARVDARPVPRPPRLPHVLRSRPRTTPTSTILTRILQAVFPVCAGINLEYYFSLRRQRRLRLRHEAAAQHRVAARRHGRRGQRPADRPALADGRDPRAGPLAVRHRDDARGDAPDHGRGTRGSAGCAATAGSSSPCSTPRPRAISVFQDGAFPALPAAGRASCPGRPPRSTGIAAGATTWSSPRSKALNRARSADSR